jgi:hypothetical protein
MAKRTDDDLFSKSTMTFGEHLEELRICLTKAVFGLLLGSILGFFVAKHVVNFIETPVLDALKRYMVEAAKEELRLKYGDKVPEAAYKVLDERVMIVEEVYLEREELARFQNPPKVDTSKTDATATTSPAAVEFDELLPPPSLNFVKTRIWRQAHAKLQSLDPWETFMIFACCRSSARLALHFLSVVDLYSGWFVRSRAKVCLHLLAAQFVAVFGRSFVGIRLRLPPRPRLPVRLQP